MTAVRPWRRALAWLAFLGPFFFASYGFANWLASRRAHVGSIVYPWEHAVPFLPWTIVPYWSIDLLYAISIFLCTTKRELDRHAQRLLFVQIVSIAFFLAFPLRFSFVHPQTGGAFGALFSALGTFDKPFNQAPSLHVGLLIVIWVCFARHVPPRWRWLVHAWMMLIGVSTLTTWQHHFIDLPTGVAVGFLALWALPDDEPSPLWPFAFTTDGHRFHVASIYAAGAAASIAFACLGGVWLWMLWVAIALAMVALNYAAIGARGFQKGTNGRLSVGARGLLAPCLAGAWLNSRLRTRGQNMAGVVDGVSIGRIPSARDLARSDVASIVDLCAEISCADAGTRGYRLFAVLDLTIPSAADLRAVAGAIEAARERGPVLVCCALGFLRSASAVTAWLLATGRARSLDEALAILRKARPGVVLRREQCAALEAWIA